MMHSHLFCQACGAANKPARTHCQACGTLLLSREEEVDGQDASTFEAGHIWQSSQPQEYFLPGGLQIQPIPVLSPKPPTRMGRRKLFTLVGAGVVSVGLVCGGSLWAANSTVHYLANLPPNNQFVNITLNGPVYSIAWGGKDITRYIASTGADQTVKVIDMDYDPDVYGGSPPISYTYRGHKDSVNSVAWSPDGTRFASASRSGLVRVTKIVEGPSNITTYSGFSVIGGNDVLTYTGHQGAVYSVAWSPKGSYLVSASADMTVQVWDATHGKLLVTYREHGSAVTSAAWSPDGTRLVSASKNGIVRVWDATNGKTILTYRGHAKEVTSVAWSSDGGRLASASTDGTVHIWDATNGESILTYSGHKGPVKVVAWEPGDRLLASGSTDTTVQVWSATDGKLVYTYKGHTSTVNTLAWPMGFGMSGPQILGPTIASGSDDETVLVWDVIGA